MRAYNSFPSTGTLLTGALIAGGLALLANPKTGAQIRDQFMDFAGKAGGDMGKRFGTALERGIEFAERGQQVLRDASAAMDSAIERGKDYLESGRSMADNMGRNRSSSSWNGNGVAAAGALLAGALIGGGLALLLTPQTGTQFRRQIKTYANKVSTFRDNAERDMEMARER